MTFSPTIAFNEGGDPPVFQSREEAVRNAGEPGWLRFLAARDKIPIFSLEPEHSEEVNFLRKD